MSVDDGLRSIFRNYVPPPAHWQSVETGHVGAGVPDSNFCIEGAEGWIEMKSTRRGWDVTLRPEQIGWLVTRARHGGRVFVAVRRRVTGGPRTDGADELYLFRGSAARELKALGLRAVHPDAPAGRRLPAGTFLGAWRGGPAAWDWLAVRRALVHG